jgi:DNA polymerase III epsilon subunit family exonuclease
MRYLFLDLETSGLSPQFCCILEIASIVVDIDDAHNIKYVDSFHEYINPKRPIPPEVTEINGITNEMVKDCRMEKEVLKSFAQWLYGGEYNKLSPIAHNGTFDFRFLVERSEMDYAFTDTLFEDMRTRLIDTLKISRALIKQGKIKTRNNKARQCDLAEAFNIDYHAHNALEDTRALVLVYNCILKIQGGK